MARILSVWFPHWPVERLTRTRRKESKPPVPDDRSFALVGTETHGLVLTAVNRRSKEDGLFPGLSLADARAIAPHLLTAPAEPALDAAHLAALGEYCERYSPSIAVDGEDGLILDVTGVPHLFGGEDGLLADMAMRLRGLGFTARAALAETIGGAYALARFSALPLTITPAGSIAMALAECPVEGLRIESETANLLKRLGLKRIGQLYALPRASLQRRFHSKQAAEAVLLRLDQALGTREEPLTPLRPAPLYAARLPFAEPLISHDGILAGLDCLTAALCAQLSAAERGAKRIRLSLYRTDATTASLDAGLSAASRQPSHLLRLLREKIERLDLGFGIDLMVLDALLTESLRADQISFAARAERAEAEALIDRLANRLGPRAIRKLHPRASHIPERGQISRSAFAGTPPSWNEGAMPPKPPRPMLLFRRPEPLAVLAEIPEGPPARFTWRHVMHRVIKAEGPERIAPEWWAFRPRSSSAERDSAENNRSSSAKRGSAENNRSRTASPCEQASGPLPLPPCGRADFASGEIEGGESHSLNPPLTPLPHKGGGGIRGSATASSPSPLVGEGGAAQSGAPDEGENSSGGSPTRLATQVGPATGRYDKPFSLQRTRPRDYYRVEDEAGQRYWLFREGLYQESGDAMPIWYVHGVFG